MRDNRSVPVAVVIGDCGCGGGGDGGDGGGSPSRKVQTSFVWWAKVVLKIAGK